VGPTNEGFQIRYQRISAKPFARGQKQASQFGDFLKATGVLGAADPIPGDPQALATLIEQSAGRTYEVNIKWRARNKNTGFTVEGMKNFPTDGKGGHQSWVEDPTAQGEDGKPLRLRANVDVDRYLPATS
jgi:hypothetical protein